MYHIHVYPTEFWQGQLLICFTDHIDKATRGEVHCGSPKNSKFCSPRLEAYGRWSDMMPESLALIDYTLTPKKYNFEPSLSLIHI